MPSTAERPRARCPVCGRVVKVTDRGGLHGHGNRYNASWEKCRKWVQPGATAGWEPDEEGVLRAPKSVEDCTKSVRSVVEGWAPEGMDRHTIDRLVRVLEDDWDRLSSEAARERKSRKAITTRVRKSRALDRETLTTIVGPVVLRGAQSYAAPEDTTTAVVEALMQWLEDGDV